MAKKARTSSTSTQRKRPKGEAKRVPTPTEVVHAFHEASRAQKALMIAGGVVVIGTSPYWVPAVVRSKRARALLSAGVGEVFSRWLSS